MADTPQITPYLFYEDCAAALEWLARVFGFRERMRTTDTDGAIRHAEMRFGNAGIMLGTPPDYRNPAHLGGVTVSLYVTVDDVDAHHRRAEAEGATIESPPTDQDYGSRNYGVLDLEGHQWWFSQEISG